MAQILLLEPNPLLADMCQRKLTGLGHDVVWRQTAEQGISALDEHKMDLIILEIQIPVHNGIEFLYEMRSYSDWLNVPVVLYTDVRPSVEFQDAFDRLKVIKWLYKPQTNLQELSRIITDIIKTS